MKSFWVILIVLICGFFVHNVLPWWSIVLVAILAAFLFKQRTGRAALATFIGGFLLWGLYALYLDRQNDGLLSAQIGELLQGLSGMGLVLLTATLGGLLSALGGIIGSLAQKMLQPIE